MLLVTLLIALLVLLALLALHALLVLMLLLVLLELSCLFCWRCFHQLCYAPRTSPSLKHFVQSARSYGQGRLKKTDHTQHCKIPCSPQDLVSKGATMACHHRPDTREMKRAWLCHHARNTHVQS